MLNSDKLQQLYDTIDIENYKKYGLRMSILDILVYKTYKHYI